MSQQLAIDWTRDTALPISGRTRAARHASASGAMVAARGRGALSVAYVKLLRECGPLSDEQAARALGRRLSSICSTRDGVGELVEPSGEWEIVVWPNGRSSRRVKWRLCRRRRTAEEMEG